MINFENLETFQKKLNNAEARSFFILYVGLDCFLKGESITKLSKNAFEKEIGGHAKQSWLLERSYSYRLRITGNGSIRYLLYHNADRKFYAFSLNETKDAAFLPISEYEDQLPDQIISLLLDVSHNNVTKDEGEKDLVALRELSMPKDFKYRFILGAGINYSYGMPQWKELELPFHKEIDALFGDNTCSHIVKNTFNTNYGSFQIVKDIKEDRYKALLNDMTKPTRFPSFVDKTTLLAVSAVLYAQSKTMGQQTVLTFNYDELVEIALSSCFGLSPQTIWKYNDEVLPEMKVVINHSHGFLPYSSPILERHFDSVVLTVGEYFKNYQTPKSYGYESLYNQLDSTCFFVGNSITDYEEQKVISAHFDKNPAQFHYCFCVPNDDMRIEAMMYKTIFLLRIGVIPLWYRDHNDYVNRLFAYAEKLRGE